MSRSSSVMLSAFGLGAVAGMRSLLAPALVSRALGSRTVGRPASEPARTLASPATGRLLPLLAAGELFADKLPITPDRTHLPSLAWRVLSGALAGAAVATARRETAFPAAVAGAVAAFGSTHAMFRLRKALVTRLEVPDMVIALAEDGLALGLGRAVLRSPSRT